MLEDAVAPQDKTAARRALQAARLPAERVMVRIKAHGTPWFDDDLQLVKSLGVQDLMLPKAESSAAGAAVCAAVGCEVRITALVESALGVLEARNVAAAPSAVRLAFGGLDFKLDTGIEGDWPELLHVHSPLELAVVNTGFAPTAQEVEWARCVLAATQDSAVALTQWRGQMIDRPVILRAQRIAATAGESPAQLSGAF